ncbi:hypothetical protein [Rhodovulum sp. MB263]|uniref:hypothetical protein n=1 Tax=Rhodovulum sp. (strain MB263) TaxID=308754 RepID=UPI0009B7480A|nr:hypothetical protein [Rhodovulum sp. MB263]ARC88802.1 hypothetical protein B5V46_09310 [Rhodovulum sp. MB263]
MSSRRYVKRTWRVPKDRGALECFATLVKKSLRKHGWPADVELRSPNQCFFIRHVDGGDELPPDFQEAAEIAVRILARTYRVEVEQHSNFVSLKRLYRVTPGGHFREEK